MSLLTADQLALVAAGQMQSVAVRSIYEYWALVQLDTLFQPASYQCVAFLHEDVLKFQFLQGAELSG